MLVLFLVKLYLFMKKNKRLKKILLIFGIIFLIISCSEKPRKTKEPQRIISMAPNITEILYSLGMQDRIVGVSDFCKYPEEAQHKESIGGLFNPNLEKITALKPDLILATKAYESLVEKLGKDRFTIVLLPEKTVEDIYTAIDSIGTLVNCSKKATLLIASIKDSLDFYITADSQIKPRAILVLGRDAGTTRNIGISGPGAFINELWVRSGGVNAFPDLPASFAQINREDLLTVNPEIVIEFKSNKNWGLEQDSVNIKEWKDIRISAVQNRKIFVIPGNHFLIPGPRMYLLAKEYNQILQKYRFDY